MALEEDKQYLHDNGLGRFRWRHRWRLTFLQDYTFAVLTVTHVEDVVLL